MTGSVLRRLAAVMTPLVVLVSFVLTGAASSPASATVAGSMSATISSSWQTNATVWKMAYAGSDVYMIGDFTSVRPPGDALGTGEVPASYFAAFNATTGALDTAVNHTHTFTGQAKGKLPLTGGAVAASPDGSVIYVGGGFTTVDGVARNHLAAFSATTGALLSWNPKVNGKVEAIATNGTTVYIGGQFTKVGTTTTGTDIAAISASGTGKALTWGTTQPSADDIVDALAVSPDGTQVVAGGYFDEMDGLTSSGTTTYNKAAIIGGIASSTPGALEPMPADSVVPVGTTAHNPNGCISNVKDAVIANGVVYIADEGTGGGCFDGTWATNLSNGTLAWVNHCLGATQTVEVVGNYLYKGSHMHDCALTNTNGDPANFPQITGTSRHLASESLSNGFLGPWYPLMDAGVNLGPRTMTTDGSQLFVGGDFTHVNGVAQQGVARFQSTPDTPTPKPTAPIVNALSSNSVEVSVEAPLDIDDPDLTLELFRNGGTTPIATTAVTSYFWKQPIVSWVDSGLAAGTDSYTVKALETDDPAAAPTAASAATKVTIPATAGSYAAAVAATSPSAFWQLNEAKGLVAGDATGSASGQGGVYASSGITYGVAGPTVDATTGVTLDGTAGMVVDPTAIAAPTSYSIGTWFKTTTTKGGKLIGFGNNNRAPSTSYDKHIYMTNAGKLVFGVYTGSTQTISSSAAYNDGKWHQVVATQGPTGMKLYVDGAQVASGNVTTNQSFTGFWRVGGDTLSSWPSAPTSSFFAGSIADVTIYNGTVLPATTVSSLYAAAQ